MLAQVIFMTEAWQMQRALRCCSVAKVAQQCVLFSGCLLCHFTSHADCCGPAALVADVSDNQTKQPGEG